jgi:hypothetical protein
VNVPTEGYVIVHVEVTLVPLPVRGEQVALPPLFAVIATVPVGVAEPLVAVTVTVDVAVWPYDIAGEVAVVVVPTEVCTVRGAKPELAAWLASPG